MTTKKEEEICIQNNQLKESCLKGIHQLANNKTIELAIELCDDLIVRKLRNEDCESFWYSQLCRSLGSIAANYAEGIGKSTNQEVLRFLKIARGSAYESYIWAKFTANEQFCLKTEHLCELIDKEIVQFIDNLGLI